MQRRDNCYLGKPITKNRIIALLKISSLVFSVGVGGKVQANNLGLVSLSDQEMSASHAQAMINMSYIAPGDPGNFESGNNIGFYKLGMEADVELNLNIRKLQLGCGGVNGAGGCDIDIDNLSLSGVADTREGRAGSSALLINPSMEFAIKNPGMIATREVVGIRLSAENMQGLLSMGDQNSATPNGINSLSGYMKIAPSTGTAYTTPRIMDYASTGNQQLTGNVSGRLCFFSICGSPIIIPYTSNNYTLSLASAPVDIQMDGVTVAGTRQSSVVLTGKGYVQNLNFSGPMVATISGLLPLTKNVTGYIQGLTANITLNQNLGMIHKLEINNPSSLSLQAQDIRWPGSDAVATRGWWLAMNDVVNVGDVSPSNTIDITNDVLAATIAPVNANLATPRDCGDIIFGCTLSSDLDVGAIDLRNDPRRFLNFPLQNLQLAAQSFAPNCWGTLTFC